eukprot:TRINITY_DN1353_c0_g1_i2.p1 TRINITY_DN1353_c0_g1~~TRINITY_DN1353_c0_g1_i2.p1  ORF type:complete len:183 (+),score=21.58 TRINITY_DN1353_c0_g1_i2:180-728(+)
MQMSCEQGVGATRRLSRGARRGVKKAVKIPERHRACCLAFTRNMHELLAAADIVVTKPGGLITSEALACGNMLVVVDPYRGQEERNASIILEEGAGLWVWNYSDMQPKLDAVLTADPGAQASLSAYQTNARRLARPDAAFAVAKYALSEAPQRHAMESLRQHHERDAKKNGVLSSCCCWKNV